MLKDGFFFLLNKNKKVFKLNSISFIQYYSGGKPNPTITGYKKDGSKVEFRRIATGGDEKCTKFRLPRNFKDLLYVKIDSSAGICELSVTEQRMNH